MAMLISIVCYFLLFSVSLAFKFNIYNSFRYYTANVSEPEQTVEETYKVEFYMNEPLVLEIRLKNKAPDVVARVYVTYRQPTKKHRGVIYNRTMDKCYHEDCLSIRLPDPRRRSEKSESISMGIQLEKENVTCATQIILEGNVTSPDATKKDTNRSLCFNQRYCTIVMDVQNACQGPKLPDQLAHPSSKTIGLLTGLAVVMGVAGIVGCVVILYMKKCWCVDSILQEPPQTYIPRNPFYVNLLFRKECQAEIFAAEHIYEEIN